MNPRKNRMTTRPLKLCAAAVHVEMIPQITYMFWSADISNGNTLHLDVP